MTWAGDLTRKNALAQKVAKGAMQERLGNKSDIESELEALEATLQAEEDSYMGRETPPPDYLSTGAKNVWAELLNNASELHFKQTEYDMMAQYCWTVDALRTLMISSGALLEPAELTQVQRLQTMSRLLSIRLRLSPMLGMAIKTKDRLNSAKNAAEQMKSMVGGGNKTNRSSLMFGGESEH